MAIERDLHKPQNEGDDRSDLLARLLRAAGAREDPPREDYEQTLAVAREALRAKRASRRRQRTFRIAGLAAAALTVAVIIWTFSVAPPVAAQAMSERVIGEVEVLAARTRTWRPLRTPADSVSAGEALRTGAGSRAAFRLASGTSLRLDQLTELTVVSAARIELRRGAVYLDSGAPRGAGTPVEVVTSVGTARDVGTQFEVRLLPNSLRLRVREGMVALRYGDGSTNATGEQLTVSSSGRVERTALRGDDQGWQWVETLAVSPVVDNQPLASALAWVGRETGRPILYSSADVEHRAKVVILHGSIGDLAPLEVLDAVLVTTDLTYAIMNDGSILIRPR